MNSARLSIPWAMLAVFAVALMLGFISLLLQCKATMDYLEEQKYYDAKKLEAELTVLKNEVDKMSNLTLRMSDEYLDLDLLDEQARDILGQIRSDEVIIQ